MASDARKKAPKSSGPKRVVPKTDKIAPPVPKTDKLKAPPSVPFRNPYARKPPKPEGEPKTNILPTAKAEKLGGALPFLPPAVKPTSPNPEGIEKTAEF